MNSHAEQPGYTQYQELLDKIQALESRVQKLESAEKPLAYAEEEESGFEGLSFKFKGSDDSGLESHIGEFGLAWLGNIVLFFGITFLVQYLQVSGYRIFSAVFGFVAVAGIFLLAHFLRNSNTYMAKIFNLTAYVLLFFVTMKLHYFAVDPLVGSSLAGLILLLAVTGVLIYLAIRKNYSLLAGITYFLIAITAILSDSTNIMLSLAAILALLSVVFLYRYGWIRLVFLAISLAYMVNLEWMFNNPLMGHHMELTAEHTAGFIFIFLTAAIFSLIALLPKNEIFYKDNSIIGTILFNGIGFAFVCFLFVMSFFKTDYVTLTGSIALFCVVYSIVLQLRSQWKITAAFYALFGFVTLSFTFYGLYGFPRVYFLLAIQSLLVVSMAIWFRSRFIVVMNTILFMVLIMVYLSTSRPLDGANISISLVALVTARILNWKKERLTIRTELIRNIYLITLFVMVLYTLYHMMPGQYVVLSWTGAALLYFVFSMILKNVKYRYLALATMIAAAFYLFIIDLSRIELVFRVIALLFLSVISIGLSFYYNKKLKKKPNN